MDIACSTSAFKTPFDDALATVGALGFTTVDLICIPGWDHVSADALLGDFDAGAARIEQQLATHGLTPIAMNMAFGHLHQRTDAEAVRHRLRQADALARLMTRLSIPIASFYPGYKAGDRPWKDVLADEAQSIRELLEVADAHGVQFVAEPHFNTVLESLDQNRDVLTAVPELKVAYDPSHFAMQSIPLTDTAFLLDRTAHVHLRDAAPGKMSVPPGEGVVDFGWILSELKQRGYDGPMSIEYLPNADADVRHAITALKQRVEADPGR